MGYQARKCEQAVRPSAETRFEYSDSGDIEITKKIEVKQRSFDFTSADDYPYETIFISEVYRMKKLLPQLEAVVILSNDGSHAACVSAATRGSWVIDKKWDVKQGRECDIVACPKQYARFVSLPTNWSADG